MAATASTPTFAELQRDIRRGALAPVYLLHGEEAYFTDRLVNEFEALVPAEERDFNFYSLYAPEVEMAQVSEACRRYPMMADRQVVILRECQSLRADQVERLAGYVGNPTPSTVLVIVFRGAVAKGAKFQKALRGAGGVIFESKKLNDSRAASVISTVIKEKGLAIEPKGLAMLRDFVGTDVARLYNEIDKLAMILGKGAMITPEAIERNVGISKDYNNFELNDAIMRRDAAKAFRIVNYFTANPKKNPAVVTISTLFSLFSGLLAYQFCKDRTERGYMQALGLKSPWALKNYQEAARNYNAYQTIEIITALRRADAATKGVGSRTDEHSILHDLVYHILNARGNIAF